MQPQKNPELLTINGLAYTQSELESLCAIKLAHPLTEEWEKKIYLFIQNWINGDSDIRIHTSGSTGIPKNLKFKKNQLVCSARMTGQYFGLKRGDSILLCLSADYIAGKMVIVRAFVLGLDLIIIKPCSNPFDYLTKPEIGFAAMVPLQIEHILNTDSRRLESIKTLIIGGAAVNENLLVRLAEINATVFITYGMTETLGHIAVKRVSKNAGYSDFAALPGVSLQADAKGHLIVSVSYLGIDRLKTNDLVVFNSSGRFELLGRSDNIINSGGIKIVPEKLEQDIGTAVEGRQFFIFGRPDERLGERAELMIEGAPFDNTRLAQLQNYFKNHLPHDHIPKKIHFMPRFVLTDSGKIQRKKTINEYIKREQ